MEQVHVYNVCMYMYNMCIVTRTDCRSKILITTLLSVVAQVLLHRGLG